MDTESVLDAGVSYAKARRVADEIYDDCMRRSASSSLGSFNRHFASRPLSRSELKLFFASLAAFNRHTIGGIAILAGRLSDEILPHLPTSGHEIGAYVLDAAVDEYGLRETVTHVELGRNFAAYLGISAEEVELRRNACSGAVQLGDALFSWYRTEPVAFALGVHTASEITSVKEFMSWHDIFLNFPQYRFSHDVPEFEYMRAHFAREPDHVNHTRICISRYLDVLPWHRELLREGAETYLDLYQKMFHELDTLIFK
jgi:pyrroloquinoline quinone (PQQ) biosynthesis protein C